MERLDTRLKEGKEIVVKNVVHTITKGAPGDLLLTVTEPGSNRKNTIPIPKAAVIFLSDFCAAESLEKSHELRSFITRGYLRLLSDEEINNLKPEERDYSLREQQRLAASATSLGDAAKSLEQMPTISDVTLDMNDEVGDDGEQPPNEKVIDAMLALEQKIINQDECIRRLSDLIPVMKTVDRDYIAVRTVGNDRTKLAAWFSQITGTSESMPSE